MNVKKFLGENSRTTLRRVRQALGEDAVILSSRQVAAGFEMMAMAHDDVANLAGPAMPAPLGQRQDARPQAVSPQGFVDFALQRKGGAAPAMMPPSANNGASVRSESPGRSEPPLPRPEPQRIDVVAELRSMRSLIEGQLASLAWSDAARRAPLRTKLAGDMLSAGFSASLARAVTGRLPDDFNAEQASGWLVSVLESNLRRAAADELIDRGGVFALVGPTGVGKTTTTAKLAARYVMKYGAQKLGLISADSYRIGAQDQLRIYGRILGVPVHAVQDAAELHATIAALSDKHLVLIDTIGVGQRDPRVPEQVAMLGSGGIKRLLMLNAACQGETLEDVVRVYAGKESGSSLAGCCITKLDESVKPGSTLDVAIRHRLPLHFVSSGQRVPEDLALADTGALVRQSMAVAGGGIFDLDADEALLMLTPAFNGKTATHA